MLSDLWLVVALAVAAGVLGWTLRGRRSAHAPEVSDAVDRARVAEARLAAAETKVAQLQGEVADRVAFTEIATKGVEQLLEPIQRELADYRTLTRELEAKRDREVGEIGHQYQDLAEATATLQREAAKLVGALRVPHVRGRWGQLTLRRTAELAGMADRCDFYEQETIEGTEGTIRPDMIVRLPLGRQVAVDSKVPLDAYLASVQAESEHEAAGHLARHARQLRSHVLKLASKDYQGQLDSSPEFVVLFVPHDSFVAAAAETDAELVEWALQRGVVIATPATFVALLRAVAYGWRQQQIAENAQRVGRLGTQLAERMALLAEHFGRVGLSLERAVDSYNTAVASFETRVLPAARRFRALGAGTRREIAELHPVPVRTRSVISPESLAQEAADGSIADTLFEFDDEVDDAADTAEPDAAGRDAGPER